MVHGAAGAKTGSSPRVRGAVERPVVSDEAAGIIPARAGSSRAARRIRRGGRDHPRACGEQSSTRFACRDAPGSSPRVRGAVWLRKDIAEDTGIIPARAGSSVDHILMTDTDGDHPRACGEQT